MSLTDESRLTPTVNDVALHEAGHAVVAWFATSVMRVRHAKIGRDSQVPGSLGHVSVDIDDADLWIQIVVLMAGMAAEVLVCGSTMSTGSGTDIVEAIATYRAHTGLGLLREVPPHPYPAAGCAHLFQSSVPFRDREDVPLPGYEMAVLKIAYEQAFDVLTAHYADLTALAVQLRETPVMDEEALRKVLGPRTFIPVAYQKAGFVLTPHRKVPLSERPWAWRLRFRYLTWKARRAVRALSPQPSLWSRLYATIWTVSSGCWSVFL